MTDAVSPHLWLALSPHGYGHAAMTAPVVQELRRRRPGLRLTIQTAISRPFLETRYGRDFTHVDRIADFGLRMRSATEIDLEASAQGYLDLHADWDGLIGREAEFLRAAAPDLVLANAPYVTIAAAVRAGIPVVAMSSLQWADMYRHYLGGRPESERIAGQMAEAYNQAEAFLRVTPAMDMPSLSRIIEIGPVGSRGKARSGHLRATLGVGPETRLGLVAFGGIDHGLALDDWPQLPGWLWLSSLDLPPGRQDFRRWEEGGLGFSDTFASVDVVVTKPGYGTFVEAALSRIPVLFVRRPDWPESPHLDNWLMAHARALPVEVESLLGQGLASQLQMLFSLPDPGLADVSGNDEAASLLELMLDGRSIYCERS